MKILVIIPAYNEEESILNVIDSIKNENELLDIVVVNDGSVDDTGILAESSGKAAVINLPCNLGIGGCVQTGFKFAARKGYDIALQLDGDGQHKPSEIPKLIGPVSKGEADVVIGSRFCEDTEGYRSTAIRRIGIKVFEWINSLIIHQRITDNTSGFRAYNRKAIGFLAQNYPTDYPEPESVIVLGKNGFHIKEVSVVMQERQGGKSSISGLKSLHYMIKVLLAILVWVCRPKTFKED